VDEHLLLFQNAKKQVASSMLDVLEVRCKNMNHSFGKKMIVSSEGKRLRRTFLTYDIYREVGRVARLQV